MRQPAAKKGDKIIGTDRHLILPPGSTSPTPMQYPFNGVIQDNLSGDVNIGGYPAATQGSVAENKPLHQPMLKPVPETFVHQPHNRGIIAAGSKTVFINGKPAARNGDKALTCNDPVDDLVGTVMATGTVFIGG